MRHALTDQDAFIKAAFLGVHVDIYDKAVRQTVAETQRSLDFEVIVLKPNASGVFTIFADPGAEHRYSFVYTDDPAKDGHAIVQEAVDRMRARRAVSTANA